MADKVSFFSLLINNPFTKIKLVPSSIESACRSCRLAAKIVESVLYICGCRAGACNYFSVYLKPYLRYINHKASWKVLKEGVILQ